MLISVSELVKRWAIKPSGVLHVGAHDAEEESEYLSYAWGHVHWVEAQPEKASILKARLNPEKNTIYEAVAWSTTGKIMDFNFATNGQSSSLLEFGTHSKNYPQIEYVKKVKMRTTRLDGLLPKEAKFDFLNLDVQGVELEVIKGLGKLIYKMNWIYTEVNRTEVYIGCSLINEIDSYLAEKGFKRVQTRWVPRKGWGDALYISANLKVSQFKIWRFKMLDNLNYIMSEILFVVKLSVKHMIKYYRKTKSRLKS